MLVTIFFRLRRLQPLDDDNELKVDWDGNGTVNGYDIGDYS